MHKILLILLVVFLSSYNCGTTGKIPPSDNALSIGDTIYIRDTAYIIDGCDSTISWRDSFIEASQERDELAYKLLRVRYYNDLIGQNPSMRIYIRGWLNRVLDD